MNVSFFSFFFFYIGPIICLRGLPWGKGSCCLFVLFTYESSGNCVITFKRRYICLSELAVITVVFDVFSMYYYCNCLFVVLEKFELQNQNLQNNLILKTFTF